MSSTFDPLAAFEVAIARHVVEGEVGAIGQLLAFVATP